MDCPKCNGEMLGLNGPPVCPRCGVENPPKKAGISVRPIFAWYDFWVGWFWDSAKRKLYILPIPCVGIVIQFPKKKFKLRASKEWFRAAAKAEEGHEIGAGIPPWANRSLSDPMQTQQRVADWKNLSDEGLRLRCGEMTAQEIRTVRAVLNAILPSRDKAKPPNDAT